MTRTALALREWARSTSAKSGFSKTCVQAAGAPASLVVTQHDNVAARKAAVPVQVRIEGAGQFRLKVRHQPRRCALPAHTTKPR